MLAFVDRVLRHFAFRRPHNGRLIEVSDDVAEDAATSTIGSGERPSALSASRKAPRIDSALSGAGMPMHPNARAQGRAARRASIGAPGWAPFRRTYRATLFEPSLVGTSLTSKKSCLRTSSPSFEKP